MKKKPVAPQAKGGQAEAAPLAKPQVFLDINNGDNFFGRLVIELHADSLPKTCENFKQLCIGTTVGDKKKDPKQASYKGCRFLRLTPDGIQTGDILRRDDGKGQDSIYGTTFDDEQLGFIPHTFGVVSMCNSGPNTNGSQFFICTTPATEPAKHLDAHHVSFGRVIVGADIVSALHGELASHVGKYGAISATCPFTIAASGLLDKPVERPTSKNA